MCSIRETWISAARHVNYRVAVGLLIGQGWEQWRPTLHQLYVSKSRPKALVFFRLNNLFWENQCINQCHSSVAFAFMSVYRLDDWCGERKKTKTFGLVLLFHLQGRVAHFIRNPALSTDQPLRGSWWYSHSLFIYSCSKMHCLLSWTHLLYTFLARQERNENL